MGQGIVPQSSQNPRIPEWIPAGKRSTNHPRIPHWIPAWGRTCSSLWIGSIRTEAGLTEFRDQIPASSLALRPIPRFSWSCFGKPGCRSMAKAMAEQDMDPGRICPESSVLPAQCQTSCWEAPGKAGNHQRFSRGSKFFQRLRVLLPCSRLPWDEGRDLCWNCAVVNPHLGSIRPLEAPELLTAFETRAPQIKLGIVGNVGNKDKRQAGFSGWRTCPEAFPALSRLRRSWAPLPRDVPELELPPLQTPCLSKGKRKCRVRIPCAAGQGITAGGKSSLDPTPCSKGGFFHPKTQEETLP